VDDKNRRKYLLTNPCVTQIVLDRCSIFTNCCIHFLDDCTHIQADGQQYHNHILSKKFCRLSYLSPSKGIKFPCGSKKELELEHKWDISYNSILNFAILSQHYSHEQTTHNCDHIFSAWARPSASLSAQYEV
jgi:hypothetical protein